MRDDHLHKKGGKGSGEESWRKGSGFTKKGGVGGEFLPQGLNVPLLEYSLRNKPMIRKEKTTT